MTDPAAPRWFSARSLLILAAALALSVAASVLGSSATTPNLPWYDTLAKPAFNPPRLAFPIAWTILYALMAIAAWRVGVLGRGEARRRALIAYGVQYVLNVGWSFAFFGAQSPALGLAVIGALLVAIAWTIVRFRVVDRAAALMLWPYLAWVSFASLLNAAILVLNR
ncbi:TspO/MBR-related protein [Methylopila jiangsuensis]|uniref:TspO/MBR-related protein n=1 Tax=Methylopila jiangsuensis TaxID=586230 RepID=A0A9W6N3U4_9HYPH|nr:TspO/MBR family protein [Methylopila jiangsuensis]MDR6286975.1 tryptophan-rich sensory protein [Methylopila jiangsuensis]GLK76675.1 TspO/MBR-related protein [Methylopila jiangsuensis]